MGKKLNADVIRSELSEGSAFFPSYKGTSSPTPQIEETPRPVEQQMPTQQPKTAIPERSNARTVERPIVRPNARRIITRNSFEVYEDQMDALRELSYQEKREGRIGSMSAMVREALDNYLKEQAKRE
jgi:hypothetical protein